MGESHEYIGGVKYIRGYHECIREGDIMNTLEDVQYIGGYHDACGLYNEYIEGCSVYIRGYHEYMGFSIEIERIYQVVPPNAS